MKSPQTNIQTIIISYTRNSVHDSQVAVAKIGPVTSLRISDKYKILLDETTQFKIWYTFQISNIVEMDYTLLFLSW